MRHGDFVAPNYRHPRMLIAQVHTPILPVLEIPQHRLLPALGIQPPLPETVRDGIRARQVILAPKVVLLAHGVAELVLDVEQGPSVDVVPGAAEVVVVEVVVVAGAGDGVTRREAGDSGILIGEAEVREDEGGVSVPVVVFDLDVVGFAVVFRDGLGVGAEAVRVE